MSAFSQRYVVTTIGANAITLTPLLGAGGAGAAPVSGTLPVSNPDNMGGHSTLVLNYTGTPDSTVFKTVGNVVTILIDADAA